MANRTDPRAVKFLENLPTFCSALAVGFGICVLFGWGLHQRILTTILPQQVTVKANTAICFVMLGVALWLVRKEVPRRARSTRIAVIALSFTVFAVGVVSFLEFEYGWSVGIDQLLFRAGAEDAWGSVRPGLMSPVTALAFALLSPAIPLLDAKGAWTRWMAQCLAVLAGAVSMFGILDFVLDFHKVHTYIALPTALLLLLFSIGIIASRVEWGVGRLLATARIGGTMVRRLLPAAICIPLVIAYFRTRGYAAGLYSEWTGVAIMTVSATLLLTVVTIWTAFVIDRTDTQREQAQEAESRLASIVTASYDGIFGESLDGIVTSWNSGAETIYGYSAEEMVGHSLTVAVPADRINEFHSLLQTVAHGSQVHHFETVRIRKDGQAFHVSLSVSPVKDETGRVVGISTVARDISERKRAEEKTQRMNRTLRALSECTERLMKATDETTMLQQVSEAVVKVAGYRMAWVGYARQDENKTVQPIAAAGGDRGYLDSANISWADVERGRGPTGSCIRSGQASVCDDILNDPRLTPWVDQARQHGYRSSIAIPLKIGTDVIGALTIYAAELGRFDAEEQQRLEELANNTTYAIMTLRAQAERKRAESELEASEAQFRALSDLVPQIVWACTPDGLNVYFNYRWVEYTGLRLEESYGKGWIEPFHPEDRQAALEAWNQAVATGEVYRIESRLRAADGSYRWFLLRGVPLRDEAGKIVKWFGTCTDIDDIKRAEAEIRKLNLELEERVEQRTAQLRESEQSVRRKLDSILSPEGDLQNLDLADVLEKEGVQSLLDDYYRVARIPLGVIDLKGRIMAGVGWEEVCVKFHRVHPQTCQNCLESDSVLSAGAAPGEFKVYKCKNNLWDVATPIVLGGKHLGNLFTGQFLFDGEPLNVELFRAQAERYGFEESSYLAALGKVPRVSRETVNTNMAFLAKLAEVLSQAGYSTIKLARSLEETRRVNTELANSNRELEAFTYSVSHDLRAPLRHISGFSKLLSEEFGATLPAEAQHHVARIEEGTRRMGMLVDDLLNLARVGRKDLNLQVTGLRTLVEESIQELKADASGREIEWKVGPLFYVECDAGLMKQVFQNLLSNSLKFTRPRARAVIEIGQQGENENQAIYVRDNGVGFSMKYADKLFGVFQRLHRTEDFEGTGVGLATVQRIIQKHGGRIWAEGKLDRGATFYFTLGNSDKSVKGTHATAGEKEDDKPTS